MAATSSFVYALVFTRDSGGVVAVAVGAVEFGTGATSTPAIGLGGGQCARVCVVDRCVSVSVSRACALVCLCVDASTEKRMASVGSAVREARCCELVVTRLGSALPFAVSAGTSVVARRAVGVEGASGMAASVSTTDGRTSNALPSAVAPASSPGGRGATVDTCTQVPRALVNGVQAGAACAP
jgi:hypothetical protein